jgi:two-component system chemotaxis sensor kinase CheA
MDIESYLPMFLAESREHLQELNLAVVKVEEDPGNAETIAEIFRIAHSFKGMSATMGFAHIAALTHAMEDLFEVLRERRGGLDREAIDVLLECLDTLGAAVEAVERDGQEELDETRLVERLHALVRSQTETAPAAPSRPLPDDLVRLAGGRRVLHVQATLGDDTLMPSVRAFMVLTALSDHGELLASAPEQETLESFDGRLIEAWLASDHETETLEEVARSVPDVVAAVVGEQESEAEDGQAADDASTLTDEPVALIAPAASEASATPKKAVTTSTVRVDAERLDQLMHLMGELVVHRTLVESLLDSSEVPGLQHAMNDLTRTSQALQTMVMQVRMIPVEAVFLRFPRLVRDLSGKLDKKVELQLTGSETELDRTVVDALGDPLVHLVRNSLDHGLESAEERVSVGKPPTGVLEISARHASGSVLISVRDDGHGIDPARVAKKAAERGLIPHDAVETIDMQKAVELLFSPGFSTAEQMSDVSGRGVGMDAVRSAIRGLGGEVIVNSELGVGTTTLIRLPLTLAIVATLLVEAAGAPFAIQLDRVERTVKLADYPIRAVAGKRMLVLRDGVLPVVDLAGALGYTASEAPSYAVVVRGADQRIVLAVDQLVGQRELVTRPLPDEVSVRSALSGGAVLSNGQIALIVDCDALTTAARGAAAPVAVAA